MIKSSGKAEDIKIAYIGGGSRGWAWTLMNDLAKEKALSGTVYLYDIDYSAAVNNAIIGNRIRDSVPEAADWRYEAVPDYETALTGADFVIISILPGTFDEMASDVHAPEKYGILMPVGDSTGVSGTIRALRTLPMYREFAEKIREYCPEAYVMTYTNPMSVCVRVMHAVFPGIRAFGCCHEVFDTQKLLAAALREYTGVEAYYRDIDIEVAGINHFTWVTKAQYKGTDLYPLYKRLADDYGDSGYLGGKDENTLNFVFESAQMVKFDLFRRFGVIAAAGDRHLAEFCPTAWYLKNDEKIAAYKFGRTSVQWRKKDLQFRLARAARLLSGEETFKLRNTSEAGVDILKALAGLTEFKTNANYPNMGQMPQAAENVVVETNILFSRNGIQPVRTEIPLPPGVMALVDRVIRIQEMTVQAALSYDLNLAFQAFLLDQSNNLDFADSKELFDTMIQNTRRYLPEAYFCG